MTVIALAGNKGGAGKSTLAINLAGALADRGDVVLLDADPQGSCLHWATAADGRNRVKVIPAADDLAMTLGENRQGVNFVLIDCPPALQAEQTLTALAEADRVLIPILPSPLDIWAGLYVKPVLQQAQTGNPGLQVLAVINQLEPRTRLSQLARQALGELGLPTATTMLRRRMAFRQAILEGRCVSDMGKRGAEAAQEIAQLIEELVD